MDIQAGLCLCESQTLKTGFLLLRPIYWAVTWDFQQCGICDQQSLTPACPYAQSDQSLCLSLEYSMIPRLLTEQHFEFLSLTGSCTESTLVKMPYCWKSHVTAQLCSIFLLPNFSNFLLGWHTVMIPIRQLIQEQSDLGLHCLSSTFYQIQVFDFRTIHHYLYQMIMTEICKQNHPSHSMPFLQFLSPWNV